MMRSKMNFSSDKVGSGSYNMIVAMSKVLEKAGGFQTVNVNPDSPGGMAGRAFGYHFTGPDLKL